MSAVMNGAVVEDGPVRGDGPAAGSGRLAGKGYAVSALADSNGGEGYG